MTLSQSRCTHTSRGTGPCVAPPGAEAPLRPAHGLCGIAGPSSTRSRSTNARVPRTIMVLAEAGLPRGQEPNPAKRAPPEANPGQPRLRSAASLGASRDSASLGATRESASLGVSWCWTRCPLPKRSCPASVTRSSSIPRNGPHASSRPGVSPPSDSATSIEAAFADERDVARRLAQRCTPQPHPIALLQNSLLRMRLSLPRFITSLHFCCAGWLLSRGRELSGERPRTLI